MQMKTLLNLQQNRLNNINAQSLSNRQIDREKQKLIDFVLDIEKYPEFIPFCLDSKVYEKEDKEDEIVIIADLTIGKRPFVDTYKSDVRL